MASYDALFIRSNSILVVEKERKKAEKAKKFAEKQAKTASAPTTTASSKTKEKKAQASTQKETPLPEYVEETPPGEKKSKFIAVVTIRQGLISLPNSSQTPG